MQAKGWMLIKKYLRMETWLNITKHNIVLKFTKILAKRN